MRFKIAIRSYLWQRQKFPHYNVQLRVCKLRVFDCKYQEWTLAYLSKNLCTRRIMGWLTESK